MRIAFTRSLRRSARIRAFPINSRISTMVVTQDTITSSFLVAQVVCNIIAPISGAIIIAICGASIAKRRFSASQCFILVNYSNCFLFKLRWAVNFVPPSLALFLACVPITRFFQFIVRLNGFQLVIKRVRPGYVIRSINRLVVPTSLGFPALYR